MKDRIRTARKEAGLTQAALAEKIGCGKQSIVSYEGGSRTPLAPIAKALASACGVNEDWLLTGEGEMHGPKTRESEMAELAMSLYESDDILRTELIKAVAKLPTEQIEGIYALAEQLVQAKEKHAHE